MRITKCDSGKKVIKAGEDMVYAGLRLLQPAELCRRCGAPVRTFLEQHRLLGERADTVLHRSNKKQ